MLRGSLFRASCGVAVASSLVLVFASGCWGIDPPAPPPKKLSPYLKRTDLKAASRGVDLDGLLDQLPSDMRENLGHNELRRKRANEWLAEHVVGQTLDLELKVVAVDSFERTGGKRWVRIWLEEPMLELLGEEMWLSAGPGFTPEGPVFGSSSPVGLDWLIVRAVVFGAESPNPSYVVIEVDDAAAAEDLIDLREKTATVRGAVHEIAFYPSVASFGQETAGGLRIRLADATVAGIPVVPGLPVSDKPTNPWGIAYEPMPVGDDVLALRDAAKLSGSDDDPNAADWTKEALYAQPDSLEGQWHGRWRSGETKEWHYGKVPADAVVQDDRLLIRFVDDWGTNLIVLKKQADGLYLGRSLIAETPTYCGPVVARVVSPERIDGAWLNDAGEPAGWDFRRKVDPAASPLQDYLDSTSATP